MTVFPQRPVILYKKARVKLADIDFSMSLLAMSIPEHKFGNICLRKKQHIHIPTHRCLLVSKQANIYREGKKPTQPFRKHSHLFYQNKPDEYHE